MRHTFDKSTSLAKHPDNLNMNCMGKIYLEEKTLIGTKELTANLCSAQNFNNLKYSWPKFQSVPFKNRVNCKL